MQSRRVAAANDVCAALQRMSQPMVTTNSTVMDSLAVLPVGSTVCLDNLTNAQP